MTWHRIPHTVWVYAWSLALITSLPYIIGYLRTPLDWQYGGAPGLPVGTQVDFNSHMAKMWQGSRGEWDYQLLFTHEPHEGIFPVQGFYVALGALTRIVPLGLPLAYHIARFALTALMVVAIWQFASRMFDELLGRWMGLIFATAVGGWSWVLLLIAPGAVKSISPIEFWLTDAFNLLGASYMPHFALAIILQIVALLSFDDWVRSQGIRSLLVLTLALFASAIVQPYVVVLMGFLLGGLALRHILFTKQLTLARSLWLLIPLGIHGGLALYQYLMMRDDPIWSTFANQNQTLSPPIIFYLLGYLPLLLPSIIGLRRLWLDRSGGQWWIVILWVVLVAVLLYAPLPTQRRYLLGVQTPLAMLAAFGWVKVVMHSRRPGRRNQITFIYVALASLSLVLMVIGNLNALGNATENSAFYRPEEVNAYAWLRDQAAPNEIVLTTFDMAGEGSGGRLVASTGQRVYAGHWFETANVQLKIADLRAFYDASTTDEWRRTFLMSDNAAYVWYDDSARLLGEWNPNRAAWLMPVFTDGNVTIYRVTDL